MHCSWKSWYLVACQDFNGELMLVQGDAVGEWVSKKVNGEWFKNSSFAIGVLEDGKIVSGCVFDNYNIASVRGTIASDIPIKRAFIKAILDYPFNVLKVNCVLITVSSANTKSRKFVEKLGFKYLVSIPNACKDGDMEIYSLVKQDCIKFME